MLRPNEGVLSLKGLCEPRIEPEVVFGLREAPPPDCSAAELVAAIDWVAHGYEIVHTHFPGWKFSAAQGWPMAACTAGCWWAMP
jgi:2-keto-4-pentenoate hydratase